MAMRSLFRYLSQRGRLFAASVSALGLVACGGGGGGDPAASQGPGTDSGEVIIGLTDAEGDFLTYSVDVLSLSLTRADGTQVETAPASTRVDFAQYQDLTEFFTAATVPRGVYTAATITLDFSQADVQVEVNGQGTPAVVRDSDGAALGQMSFAIDLADERPLLVRPGIPAHLTVDFDLSASHTVDTSVAPPLVTANPVLVADIDSELPKPHRLRGLLGQVDEASSTFTIGIRPFWVRDGAFGSLPVFVDEDTAYEIDGEVYAGTAGLSALAALDRLVPVIAFGQIVLPERRFVADEVSAGSSVPGAGQDVVRGTVIARTGDVLTVKGATVVRGNGSVVFNDEIVVNLGQSTRVTRQGFAGADLAIDAISVGQGVVAFGSLTGDEAGGLTLDVSAGRVRMTLSQVSGEVISTAAGSLLMDVQRINGRDVSLFDFTGTGATGNDANPDLYEVNTGTLSLDRLQPLDPVKARGFVAPFGSAPADFDARTVSAFAEQIPAQLGVTWSPASAAAFSSVDADRIILNLTGIGGRHHVRRGGIVTDLTTLSSPPTVVPAGDQGIYAIVQNRSAQIYRTFEDFATGLSARLGQGAAVTGLAAEGVFQNDDVTFNANALRVVLR